MRALEADCAEVALENGCFEHRGFAHERIGRRFGRTGSGPRGQLTAFRLACGLHSDLTKNSTGASLFTHGPFKSLKLPERLVTKHSFCDRLTRRLAPKMSAKSVKDRPS